MNITSNINIIIISIILLIFIDILFLKDNKNSIVMSIKNYLFNNKQIAKQETPYSIIHYLNKNLNKIININNRFLLIDFGCGDGTSLKMFNFCNNKIGIEIDTYTYKLALQNCKYHNNIKLINGDILNYNFNTDTILYMYEPLWLCKDYLPIYEKLFENIYSSKHKIYIIYLTGVTKQLDELFFMKYKLKLIHKQIHGAILVNRYLYIYSN